MTISSPPTLTGFQSFVTINMGVPTTALDSGGDSVATAFQVAQDMVNPVFAYLTPDLFTIATYNLAGHQLIEYAPDQAGQTFFKDLRSQFGLNAFAPGVVNSAGDAGTSASLVTPEFMNRLALSDLQLLKTPWGRRYLEISQAFGPLWGMS